MNLKTTFFISLSLIISSNASIASSVKDTLNSIKPENTIIQFPSKKEAVKVQSLTFINGTGHGQSLRATTFKNLGKAKIKVFIAEISDHISFKKRNCIANKVPFDYPESDFCYSIFEGSLSQTEFNKLTSDLYFIHKSKIFKEAKSNHHTPVRIDGRKVTYQSYGIGSSLSSKNYVNIVNVDNFDVNGFLYEFAGYQSSKSDEENFRLRAMAKVIKKVLSQINLAPLTAANKVHRQTFHHQFSIIKRYYNQDSWSWVKERALKLSGGLGQKDETSSLLFEELKESNLKETDEVKVRMQHILVSALAKLTDQDFRYSTKNKALPIKKTLKSYKKIMQ